jgi:hypothetical protein
MKYVTSFLTQGRGHQEYIPLNDLFILPFDVINQNVYKIFYLTQYHEGSLYDNFLKESLLRGVQHKR